MKIQFVLFGLLLVLSILTNGITSKCGEGCLSCREDEDTGATLCAVCDLYNSYVKTNNAACEKIDIENCQIPSLNRLTNICLLCEPNYILDTVQEKCVSVPLSHTIKDCKRYSQGRACMECTTGHYIFAGKCVKSETEVENCETYSQDGICENCMEEFFLDKDDNLCKEYPKIKNCSKYKTIGCEECLPGYSKNLNVYLNITVSNSFVQNMSYLDVFSPQVKQGSDDICEKNQVKNCLIHETPNSCMRCVDGYYVNKMKSCSKEPINRIQDCQVYDNQSTCKRCTELFYLNGNQCDRRTAHFELCKSYVDNADECNECVSGYKLDAIGKSCTKRTVFTNNCVEYEKKSDDCSQCNNTTYLNNSKNCLQKIEGCVSYDLSQASKTCTQCNPDYYPPILYYLWGEKQPAR